MITLISGTNRKESKTKMVTSAIHTLLKEKTETDTHQINLDEVDHGIYHPDMYAQESVHTDLAEMQDNYLLKSDLWIIVTPEYNGSFPGAIKMLIDALSIRKYAELFRGRKVALVGVASGRAGNLRGMEHLTGLLNYLGMVVYPNKLPISSIEKQITEDGSLNEGTTDALHKWIDGLKQFNT